MKYFILAGIASFILSSLTAESFRVVRAESVGMSTKRLEILTNQLDDYVDKNQLSGGVALVLRKGKAAYFRSFGYRDLEYKDSSDIDAYSDIDWGPSYGKDIHSGTIYDAEDHGEPPNGLMTQPKETVTPFHPSQGGQTQATAPKSKSVTARSAPSPHREGGGEHGGMTRGDQSRDPTGGSPF